jgi:ABC-type uncharacterized transport system permease subunit
MTGYSVSFLSGSPWLGVAAAGCGCGCAGAGLGLIHGIVCSFPRVNDVAVGIVLLILGTGLGVFLGKPFIHPHASQFPSINLGW